MSGLTPEAEKLVRAGRAALRPSDADRERVLQALLPQIGRSPGAEGMNRPSTAPASASGAIAKATAALVAIGVAGAGIFVALRSETPPASPAAIATATLNAMAREPVDHVASAAPQAQPTAPQAQPAAPQAQPSDEKRASAAARSADSLAEEVAMLSQASTELHAGRAATALTMLDEHRRKFPRGILSQERTSAHIQALCALGRMNEAQAELARLARTSPDSPHLARARKACAFGTTKKD